MWTFVRNDRGSALVTALFFITGLTAIATIIVFVTGAERKVAHNEYTHMRAFNSSDAGTEEAINWLRIQGFPPDEDPNNDNKVLDQTTHAPLYDPNASYQEDNRYLYDITYAGKSWNPAYGTEWVDYNYTIDAEGASAQESSTNIEVQAGRLFANTSGGY
jgi:hypothetical protein